MLWKRPSSLMSRPTERQIRIACSATTEKTFGQRGRSEPVTGEALGVWRAAWGRAAVSA